MAGRFIKHGLYLLLISILVTDCDQEFRYPPEQIPEIPATEGDTLVTYEDPEGFPGVPKSDVYEVTIHQGFRKKDVVVFQNSCPVYQQGYMDMLTKDKGPLNKFKGRSISWVNFSFSGEVKVEVRVINKVKVPLAGTIRVLPSRFGIVPETDGDVISFTLTQPGQFSVEVGKNGYKNGLMIFANPLETGVPSPEEDGYLVVDHATGADVTSVPAEYSGIWFGTGVHDIGIYHVPKGVDNIYIPGDAWVYGTMIMDGRPNVRIFGRGVLSAGRINYRASHTVEGINGSDNIRLQGIVVEDSKRFSVRLIGRNNTVQWVKVIGGWVYNVDGISAFAGSLVEHCFIWANDDNIKVYRDDITFSDIVCWQLDNGGIIQMSWGGAVGGSSANNVTISRVDILHAEWANSRFNSGLLSCVGNRYQDPYRYALQQDWLIEDITTEGPIPQIINIRPNDYTPNDIHGMVLKNWNVRMDMSTGFHNYILGTDPNEKFDGFVFDNFVFNDTKFTEDNWLTEGNFVVQNLEDPEFH